VFTAMLYGSLHMAINDVAGGRVYHVTCTRFSSWISGSQFCVRSSYIKT